MTASKLTPAFMESFSCLGEACEDTCCKGWGMQINNAMIGRYRHSAPELLEAVDRAGDQPLMKRDALTDYCVKFEGGLCGIHKKYGETYLGDACYFYPRMTRGLGDQAVVSGALSCPEITRMALREGADFTLRQDQAGRFPENMIDYLPENMSAEHALSIHNAVIAAALNEQYSPARCLMQLWCAAQSLENIPVHSWPDAVPFFLANAEQRIPEAASSENDLFFLLQALCGLIAAAKKGSQSRLMKVVHDMEAALHVTIQWDTLAIAHMPDSRHAVAQLELDWHRQQWHATLAPVLRRYLAAQLSLSFFPFSGLGETLSERMSILAVRFATVRLALMSACRLDSSPPGNDECVRIVQSISRFLDHLSGANISLAIYKDAGWTSAARLRTIVGDI